MSEPDRLWLDVPFGEKDQAKSAGARWDPAMMRWYAPSSELGPLSRWAALPDVPDLLPGEDRQFGSGLFVDLVPSSCWFTNVRSCVDQRDWERLRRMINSRAGQRCEVCGRGQDREVKRWLEAHERWFYDEPTRVQSLRRLLCLCSDCHRATHFGLAEIQGKRQQALAHLCTITGMTAVQAEHHVRSAFNTWRQRSARSWTLDLGILTNAGLRIVQPPASAERGVIAGNTLRSVRTSTPERLMSSAPPQADMDKVYAVLDAWAAHESWITVPPWPWFCGMCDSSAHPPDIALAKVRKVFLRRYEIVCQGVEWRHCFERPSVGQVGPEERRAIDQVGPEERRAIKEMGRTALTARGTAARWNRRSHRFEVVSGRQIAWQKDGQRGRGIHG